MQPRSVSEVLDAGDQIFRTYSLNDIVNQFLGLIDLFFGIGHDETMQVLFLVAGVGGIGSAFAFLDGTLATNGNLGSRVAFHLLQSVTSRPDK